MKRIMAIAVAVVLLLAMALPATVVAAPATVWHVPGDFDTIQEAVDAASDGDKIVVGAGEWYGAVVDKAVEIKGEEGAVIVDGPLYGGPLKFGFKLYDYVDSMLVTGSGATISHLSFDVDFPVFAFKADDVTVEHCTLINPLQGISNWGGSRWQISHNNIVDLRTDCGGGIGIFIGDFTAIEAGVNDNLVSHNKITGTLHVAPDDCGSYNGTGIVLYADFRWSAPGAVEIARNRVVHNDVSLTSDTPEVVDVVAIGLDDTREVVGVIYDNVIGFNDLRGTVIQIALTPEELEEHNTISRNLGDNRGHGVVPADIFRPVPEE